jgi:Flp pilus assembly protein TadD
VLGAIYQKEEKYWPAVHQYDLALKLNPGDVSSLTNRGEIYLKLGKFDQAAADLQQAMKLDPSNKNSAANRARLLVGLVQDALQLAKEQGIEAVVTQRKSATQKAVNH